MIGERLKNLREERNLLQKDVASYLNITTSAYGFYEQGKRNPDMETIKKLADFFNVSADYLLGRINIKNDFTNTKASLDKNIEEQSRFKEVESKIIERLINEGIILEGEPIPQEIIDKLFKYGVDATVEIFKLKKKLEE